MALILLTSTIAIGIWQLVAGAKVCSPLLISVLWAVYANIPPFLLVGTIDLPGGLIACTPLCVYLCLSWSDTVEDVLEQLDAQSMLKERRLFFGIKLPDSIETLEWMLLLREDE